MDYTNPDMNDDHHSRNQNNINDSDDDDDDETMVVTWLSEDEYDSGSASRDGKNEAKSAKSATTTTTKTKPKTTWGSKLSPKVKERIILAGQQRAIQNKQKRISDMDRKRRTCYPSYIYYVYFHGLFSIGFETISHMESTYFLAFFSSANRSINVRQGAAARKETEQ